MELEKERKAHRHLSDLTRYLGLEAPMENSRDEVAWRFGAANPALEAASAMSLRSMIHRLNACVDESDPRPLAPLGHGDPSPFACFRAAAAAEAAVAVAATSGKYNSYTTTAGLTEACRCVQRTCLCLLCRRKRVVFFSPSIRFLAFFTCSHQYMHGLNCLVTCQFSIYDSCVLIISFATSLECFR